MTARERLEGGVRITIGIDDEAMARAVAYTGLRDKSELIRAALQALIERGSARRLSWLGGSEPRLMPVRRRRREG